MVYAVCCMVHDASCVAHTGASYVLSSCTIQHTAYIIHHDTHRCVLRALIMHHTAVLQHTAYIIHHDTHRCVLRALIMHHTAVLQHTSYIIHHDTHRCVLRLISEYMPCMSMSEYTLHTPVRPTGSHRWFVLRLFFDGHCAGTFVLLCIVYVRPNGFI
jgi:hypothetical protein